jgi:hypothetical protein
MALPIRKSHFFDQPIFDQLNIPCFREQMPFDTAIMFLIFWKN